MKYILLCGLFVMLIASCKIKDDNRIIEHSQQANIQTDSSSVIPDKFLSAIKSLEEIGFYRQKLNCEIPLDSGFCCQLNPKEDWLTKVITENNKDFINDSISGQLIKPINIEGLKEIKQCFLIADYEVQKNTYPRTTIFEWTFSSSDYAYSTEKQLNNLTENAWFYISKTPITWWTMKNKIYFIAPAGFFVLSEVPKIEKQLKLKLK